MKGRTLFLCLVFAPALLFSLEYAAGADIKHPDPVIARKLNITVQELHGLRARFGLDNDELVAMPRIDLTEMLDEISRPGIDKHAEEQEFQTERLKDEHGNIPADGLAKAMKAHYRHQHPEHPGHPHEDDEGDLFPALPDPSTNEPSFGDGGAGSGLAGIGTNGWTWLGPGNIGGRVRSILIHPTLTNIMWCGGVDGGVWKTTNSGAAWFPLNDFMGNLAIASLALDPFNTNIIYAGTGEGTHNADAIRGAGIFKSLDGGSNWVQLASTANSSFQYVGRLSFDPTNSQVLLAATQSGVWRSPNGGTNWTQRLSTEVLCVAFNPTDSSQAVASGYNGNTFYSADGGLTWTPATGIPAPAGFPKGRVELAYSRSNPLMVYASVDTNSGSVYLSTDGGHSYAFRSTGYNYLSSQGWYDNFIWADPVNTNIVIVGGTDVYRSTDGGVTFTDIGGYSGSIHPDQHVLVASPLFNGTTIRTIFVGNDGGVFRAGDAYNASSSSGWQSLNNNLGITQFYGGAGNPASGVVVGGTQDNGSLRNAPGGGTSGWTAMFGGDGGFAAADQSDPLYFYGEYVYLQIHRSVNGGLSSGYIYNGISDANSSSTANFVAPYILDPNNPSTMLAGGVSLWRSTNVKASTPSWAAIKPATTGSSHISAIAVAPGNQSVIWVGHNNGDIYSTANGTNASPTWVLRDVGITNLPDRFCERIAICPTNANKVYVTFGGFSSPNVWRTTDGGTNWVAISAGLPPAPVNSITIAPTDPNTLYVGTEVGIYGSIDDGATWSTGNDGPANVSVEELFWMSNKLVAVTHGRGMFATTPTLGPPALAASGSVISGGNGNGLIDPNECNLVNLIVQNIGGGAATNVSAVLSTTTPGVSIIRGSAVYPNVATGAFATNSTPFQITTLPSFTCGTSIALTMTVTFNSSTNVLAYSVGTTPYVLTQTTGASIVPGTTDIGNHDDDIATTISLPFNYTFYGQTYANITIDSNGKLHFDPLGSDWQNTCFPASYGNTIFALWDDLVTSGTGNGVFTSISGSAPNRIFNIEWRAIYFSSGLPVNFEARLYENQQRLDLVYGTLNGNGSSATVGIQRDQGVFTAFECNSSGLSPGLQLTFQPGCSAGTGPCAPLAGFTGTPTTGAAPLPVVFSNSSAGATNYLWDFGDGNFSSAANPTNTYASAGNYSVILAAVGPGGTNSLTRTNYILVTNAPAQLVVSPVSLSFGAVFTGLTAQASLVVSNSGAGILNGSASLSAGPFTLLDPSSNAVTTLPFNVSASSATNIGVAFTPPTVSAFSNAIVFTSNGGSSTNSITGQGLIAPALLSPTLSPDGFTFSFNTVNGKTYVIEYKDDLTDPVWQTLQTITGDGTLKIVTNSTAVPAQRFYRLTSQ